MKKLLNWWDKYILKLGVAFLLVFIPLYPKLPLLDIVHTWVYIRAEDFLVAFLSLIFIIELARKKANIKTPLTIPIFAYWTIGLISSVHAILVFVPQLSELFSHLVILHYLRRIEYMILFFIAASSIRSKKDVYHYIYIFLAMTIGVVVYGFGQKFIGFPAFLTMNEEFAKGTALRFPPRVTSTFAGHYDLAAFLVFALSLIGSLIFGFKRIISKIFLLLLFLASYTILLFTSSRISFGVYLAAISLMLVLHKKKWLIIPVLVLSAFLMKEISGTSTRFLKTFRVEPVVYDVKTGKAISTLQDFELTPTPTTTPGVTPIVEEKPSPPSKAEPTPFEELPTGTGYIDVPIAETIRSKFISQLKTEDLLIASKAAHLATSSGEFLIKKAVVYDISFTTRFQGEWPRAIEAFKRNIFLGSGFSSISLATDNDYLRLLGESGILGFFSFLSILFVFLLVARRLIFTLEDKVLKSAVIGIAAGVFGIALNAVLIDVFEASKVAYILWIMIGIVIGLYGIFIKDKEPLLKEVYAVFKEPLTALIILFILAVVFFYGAVSNYFTADDFTWLKWAATSSFGNITDFFISSDGFFYRPFTKSLVFILHLFLGFNSEGYHIVSFIAHFFASTAVYFITRHITKNWWVSLLAGLFFLTHPIHSETVLWMSGYSGLFAGLFYFFSFYLFIKWHDWFYQGKDKLSKIKKWTLYMVSILGFMLALSSYEFAATLPFVALAYLLLFNKKSGFKSKIINSLAISMPYFAVFDVYLFVRNIIAESHFLSGDYSYNPSNYIFNFMGNIIGYFGEMIISFHFIAYYDFARQFFRDNKMLSLVLVFAFVSFVIVLHKLIKKQKIKPDKVLIFSLIWFVAGLLPALGLGNIAERYLYIPSFGFILASAVVFRIIMDKINSKKRNIKIVTKLVFIVAIGAILGFYYQEMSSAVKDWKEAGEIANKSLRALPTKYREFPEGSTLYFVNLPLRINRAWVFPVGLEDGLWFIYRDETLKILKGTDIDAAMEYEKNTPYTYVFLFQDGELTEAEYITIEVKPEETDNE